MDIDRIQHLLADIKKILQHQEELERIKGKKFNVFSILNMENKENETHSAFISELLNPHGSHLKGDTFLKLFLAQINNDKLDSKTAIVTVEKHIGVVDQKNKTGGRIDIFITDGNNMISIENKIYAGDQKAQVERYCNYEKARNKVYYLTLNGVEPSEDSRGGLDVDKDFFCVSYKIDIIAWLDACLKEAVNEPILRESIKQYSILLKKLTYTMDKKEQEEIERIILENYKEARTIFDNLENATNQIRKKVREEVIKKLKKETKDYFEIKEGNPIEKHFSQIWIWLPNFKEAKLHFGIESFSGKGNYKGDMYIGIINRNAKSGKSKYADLNDNTSHLSNWWINLKKFEPCGGFKMNLNNAETLKFLTEADNMKRFVDEIVRQVIEYLNEEKDNLLKYLEVNRQNKAHN